MPRQEQEQPGQQGEIIRGEKVRRRKSYVRRQQITVKSLRYRSQRPVLKSQRPLVHVPQQGEQGRAGGEAHPHRYVPQQFFQWDHQQHAGADQRQHAEPDLLLRHEEHRHQRHHPAAAEHRQSPPEGPPPQAEAKSGEEDKGPADALLPDVRAGAPVPIPVRVEQIHQVPAGVIGDHAHQRQAPQGIQGGDPPSGPDQCPSPAVCCHLPLLLSGDRRNRSSISLRGQPRCSRRYSVGSCPVTSLNARVNFPWLS